MLWRKQLWGAIILPWIGCSTPIPQEVITQKAYEVVQIIKDAYVEDPLINVVRLEDFNLLDRAYYQTQQSQLEAVGLRWLGDLEFKHFSQHDISLKTCLRTFIDPSGSISAAVWQIHPGPKFPKGHKTVEFETEFSDGHWVISRNHADSKMRPDPERVTEIIVPTDSIPDLLQKHQAAVASYRAAHSVQPLIIHTLQDLIAAQKRQAVLEARYRKKINGITDTELKDLAPQFSAADRQRLLQEIHRIYASP